MWLCFHFLKFPEYRSSKILRIMKRLFSNIKSSINRLSSFTRKCYNFHLMFFLEDTDPILPNVHFMLSGKCWSHIRDAQEFLGRIFRFVGPRPCGIFKKFHYQVFEMSKIILLDMSWDFSWIHLSVLVSPNVKIVGFGSHGHVPKSENHEMMGFRWFSSFPIMNPKRLLVQNAAE